MGTRTMPSVNGKEMTMDDLLEYKETKAIIGVIEAINTKDYSKVKEEIAKGKDPNLGNRAMSRAALPLELAVWKKDQELVDILLDAGADVKKCLVKINAYKRVPMVQVANIKHSKKGGSSWPNLAPVMGSAW